MIELQADQEVTLTLKAVEAQIVINALGMMPYTQVSELIPKLLGQLSSTEPMPQ